MWTAALSRASRAVTGDDEEILARGPPSDLTPDETPAMAFRAIAMAKPSLAASLRRFTGGKQFPVGPLLDASVRGINALAENKLGSATIRTGLTALSSKPDNRGETAIRRFVTNARGPGRVKRARDSVQMRFAARSRGRGRDRTSAGRRSDSSSGPAAGEALQGMVGTRRGDGGPPEVREGHKFEHGAAADAALRRSPGSFRRGCVAARRRRERIDAAQRTDRGAGDLARVRSVPSRARATRQSEGGLVGFGGKLSSRPTGPKRRAARRGRARTTPPSARLLLREAARRVRGQQDSKLHLLRLLRAVADAFRRRPPRAAAAYALFSRAKLHSM